MFNSKEDLGQEALTEALKNKRKKRDSDSKGNANSLSEDPLAKSEGSKEDLKDALRLALHGYSSAEEEVSATQAPPLNIKKEEVPYLTVVEGTKVFPEDIPNAPFVVPVAVNEVVKSPSSSSSERVASAPPEPSPVKAPQETEVPTAKLQPAPDIPSSVEALKVVAPEEAVVSPPKQLGKTAWSRIIDFFLSYDTEKFLRKTALFMLLAMAALTIVSSVRGISISERRGFTVPGLSSVAGLVQGSGGNGLTLQSLVPSIPFLSRTPSQKDSHEVLQRRALSEGKPVNFYILSRIFNSERNKTQIRQVEDRGDAVALIVNLELASEAVSSVEVDGVRHPNSAAIAFFAVSGNRARVRSRAAEIKIAIESFYLGRTIPSQERLEKEVSKLIKRVSGVPVKVEKIAIYSSPRGR